MSKPKVTDLDATLKAVIEAKDSDKILTKPVNVSSFTGKDEYILAYDEVNGEFYLKADEGEGGV